MCSDLQTIVGESSKVAPLNDPRFITWVAPLLSEEHEVTVRGRTDPSLPERDRRGGVAYVRVPGGMLDIYHDNCVAFLRKNEYDLIHICNRPRMVMPVRGAALKAQTYILRRRSGPVLGGLGRRRPQGAGERAPGARAVGHEGDPVVGRLSPKKGADILVRAMPGLARRHSGVALVPVGKKWYGEGEVSDYAAYVRSLAACSPIPMAVTGFVPADQVHHWFWVGDLFVCALRWEEPLAGWTHEAMAVGLPIVTTARGGNPEVMSGAECGIVVGRPDQPGAMGRGAGDAAVESDSAGIAQAGGAEARGVQVQPGAGRPGDW